ncbi:hypothetical protein [Flavobacterium ginsengiterrae]|uniref:Uncharacterized protein n=1 Tax=Flavobacterium ginsengiterrae TaxID=871695 RepID=A0ABP7GN60_9FLAO
MQNIEEEIKNLTTLLFQLADHCCWNTLSKNVVFIISNISDVESEIFPKQRDLRNKQNKNKTPKSFEEAIADLKEIYDSIYDINLYVYKSEKRKTILDIRYFLKSNLDPDFLKTVADNSPLLHSKIAHPPYLRKNEKFDINWELGGTRHHWKTFWRKMEFRKLSQTKYKL